jgi:hypothetical protein
MAKKKRHYNHTFYKSPCFIKGCPPKMIRLVEFCKRFNYSQNQVMNLLRDRHVIGKTFKNLFFVTPNHCSHLWSDAVITEFWGENWRDRLED